jgi:hypothetical protein
MKHNVQCCRRKGRKKESESKERKKLTPKMLLHSVIHSLILHPIQVPFVHKSQLDDEAIKSTILDGLAELSFQCVIIPTRE